MSSAALFSRVLFLSLSLTEEALKHQLATQLTQGTT